VFTGPVSSGEDPMVHAAFGRRVAPDEQPQAPLTWSRGVENGRAVWTCDRCSREHLRGIEGRLDPGWW